MVGTRGRVEQAAKLCGGAELLLDSIGARFESADHVAYEQTVASTRAQLDDATFAAAWAAGRAMPLEQAIAEALAE